MVLDIYGRKVPVKIKPTPPDTYGIYDPETHEIHISPTCPPEKKLNVLIHEVLHAIYDRIGVYNIPGMDSIACEELLVVNVGNILSECGLFKQATKCKRRK